MILFGHFIPFHYLVIGAMAALFALSLVLRARGAKRQEAHDAALAEGARARGWHFATDHSPGRLVHRYGGSADGVKWTAESAADRRSGRSRGTWANRTRWNGAAPPLRGQVVEIWPARGSGIQSGVELSPDNPLVRMLFRPITEALGVDESRTGELLDVREWNSGGALERHFSVRATDPAAAERLFDDDARAALLAYGEWTAQSGSARHGGGLILALFWDQGLTILARWADIEGLARLTEVGSALCKAPGRGLGNVPAA
ncbi:MAG: hypothetical protein AAB409_02355 [Gemmatimonadota bacterium]